MEEWLFQQGEIKTTLKTENVFLLWQSDEVITSVVLISDSCLYISI